MSTLKKQPLLLVIPLAMLLSGCGESSDQEDKEGKDPEPIYVQMPNGHWELAPGSPPARRVYGGTYESEHGFSGGAHGEGGE